MKNIKQSLQLGGLLTFVFLILFYFLNKDVKTNELLLATPYFVVLYFMIFTLGQPEILKKIQLYTQNQTEKVLLLPIFLIFVIYSYLSINGNSPFEASNGLFVFYFLFPILFFLAFKKTQIVWSDFVVLLLFLIPATMISFKGNMSIPYKGSGFGSVFKIVIILATVYLFSVIRKIEDIGFYPIFKMKFLGIALFSWLSFLGFVFVIGYLYDFITPNPFALFSFEGIPLGIKELIRVFIGTALFEELFFRGLIQNMLAKKIGQQGNWKKYWCWGFGVFMILALITGYALNKEIFWFPALITILLFVPAYFIENKNVATFGVYTSMAITSIFFGLVHFHAGSIIFVGLASVAGWAYGYTYIKTQNVFYAALVHTLVNTSEFLFVLDGLK